MLAWSCCRLAGRQYVHFVVARPTFILTPYVYNVQTVYKLKSSVISAYYRHLMDRTLWLCVCVCIIINIYMCIYVYIHLYVYGYVYIYVCIYIYVYKVKFTLEQATKTQRGSRCTALLFH